MSVEVLHVAPPRSVGTWRLDCSSASVVFVGRHRIAGTIRGRFTGVSGSVHIDSDPAQSWVDVDIDMDSYDFGSAMWNDVVRAGDLLCGGADRSATFRSTGVHWVDERGTVDGDLTIRATTHPVRLDVGLLTDPYDGGGTPAFRAVTRIDREVFGLRFALPVPGGNRLLAREISIEIAVSGATAR
jgi:polyisoprenoid-binding protein YceI